MSEKKKNTSNENRNRGTYVSAVQDDDSGQWRGVVDSVKGDGSDAHRLWTSTSTHTDSIDATAEAESWCRDRGFTYSQG